MKALRFLLAAALALEFLSFPVAAAPGDLDPTFGSGGKVTTAIGTGNDVGYSVAVQSDGRIVVAGSATFGSDTDFAVVRYNADGSVDTSFGFEGKAITSFGSGIDRGNGVVLQQDGKILVAGIASNATGSDFGLVRYNSDGSPDLSFGIDGKVATNFGATNNAGGRSLAVYGDGRIVVAGAFNGNFSVARYNADGSLDTGFNGTGKVITALGGGGGESVALQSDGKIVVAGYNTNGSNADIQLARYNSNGSLDTSFGFSGTVKLAIGAGHDYGYGVALQSNGKIVVAGYSNNGSDNDFALVRFNADGSLDASFGLGGRVTTTFGIEGDIGRSIVVQNDGKIVVAGWTTNSGNDDFGLMRYNTNGSLDTTFNGTGKLIQPIGSSQDLGYSVALQADGKIVVAGSARFGSQDDIAIVRFEGSLPAVAAPTSTTGTASSVTTSGAMISGTVNANGADSTVTFQYGLTTAYGSTVAGIPSPVTGSTATAVSTVLTGLASGTTYHYRVVAANSQGTVAGLDRTFTTAGPPGATTGIASGITKNGAMLTGAVNAGGSATDAYFEYGTTTDYGVTTTPQAVGAGTSPVGVQAGIGGLSPNTRYHYRLVSTNAGGTSFGNDAEFTTDFDPPTAVTNAPSSITSTSATLRGTVNPSSAVTTVHFEYGATAAYGSATPGQVVPAGSSDVSVSAVVTGLEPGVFYHFRVVASNTKGTAAGGDGFFGTPPGSGGDTPTAPPTVTTNAATAVTVSGASLNGVVNPNGGATVVQFEYGLTTSYGSTTSIQNVGNGGTNVNVSETISGLQPATEYHYRLVASNSLGTTLGPDRTWMTDFPPPTVVTGSAEAIGSTFATFKGTVNPNGTSTTVKFQYGLDTSYGSEMSVGGPLAGASVQNVTGALAAGALLPNTTYHFRLVAENTGGTVAGGDASFTTTDALAPAAVDDVIFTTRLRDSNGTIDVLANDTDPDTGTRTGLVLDGISGQQFPTRGTIVANSNGTVTYKALNGFDPEGDSFTYTVKKQNAPTLTAQATVRVLSFVPFEGFYADVFRAAAGGAVPAGGALTCKLTKLGAGTLTLDWLGKKYNDKVVFDATGRAVTDVPKLGFPAGTVLHLDLQLDATGGNSVINALLTDHQTPVDAGVKHVATLLSAGAGGSNVTAGVHNGFFDLGTSSAAAESVSERDLSGGAGFGFNIANISKSKRGRFIGRVPDFEKYSKGSVAPTRNRYVVNPGLYRLQRALRGALLGQVDLGGVSESVSFASDFQWRRDEVPGVFTGFDRRLILGGELYRASNETSADVALRIFGGDGRAQVRFEGGGLVSPKVAQIKVTLASVLRGDGLLEATGGMPGLKFRMQSNVGRYSGSFTHPDTGSKAKFEGILRRRSDSLDPRKGAGAFKSEDGATGSVIILPLGI